MTRCVGVDLDRRRSVIVVLDGDGTELWTTRIDNSPVTLGLEIEKAGPNPEVVLEATWGWYWAADVITQAGGNVHLAHPLGIAGFENRRVKNDQIDARLLADLLLSTNSTSSAKPTTWSSWGHPAPARPISPSP
jgi:hypothetical protein